jgi:hypothetical protein
LENHLVDQRNKDGVTVAEIELKDPLENMGAQMVKKPLKQMI